MAIALLQHRTTDTLVTNTGLSLAFSSNLTAGSLIVVTAIWASASGVGSISDSKGQGFTSRTQQAVFSGAAQLRHFFFPSSAAGADTISLATTVSFTSAALNISEWSGAQATATMDSGNSSTDALATGTSAAPKSLSVTPSQGNCLIYGSELNQSIAVAAAGSGFTLLDNSPTLNLATAYQIQTTATAVQSSFTISSATWYAAALIFQAAAAGGSTVFRRTASALGTRAGSRRVF